MIEMRRFEENDTEAVVRLLNLAFGGWHGVSYWKWKYLRNPAGLECSIWIAKDGDRVVGCYGIIPTMMKIGSSNVLGAQAVDAATHPRYRYRGISVKLFDHVLEEAVKTGISMVYGFPGTGSYRAFTKLGFRRIFELSQMMAVMNPLALSTVRWRDTVSAPTALWKYTHRLPQSEDERDALDRFKNTAMRVGGFVRSGLRLTRTRSPCNETSVGLLTKFDRRFDLLWSSVAERYDVAVSRETDYLDWRYFHNPEQRYLVTTFEEHNQLLGYLVLATRDIEKAIIGYLVDIVGTDVRIIESLLNFALRYLNRIGAAAAFAWRPSDIDYLATFKRVGFFPVELGMKIPARFGYSIMALATRPNVSRLVANPSTRWHFSMGDSDWV
jgi:GNAT superfamily N-acetyltransferase